MPSLKETAQQPTYSPHSSETGIYPKNFTDEELEKLDLAAKELLKEGEWIIPLIPKLLIEESVNWFADHLINELISEKQILDLETFREKAKDYVITYNLKGAEQFKKALEKACLKILQDRFKEVKSIEDTGLNFVDIHVTSSNGLKSFSKENIFEKWLEDLMGKKLISLDDIGDRGVTQKSIKERAIKDGAKEVITVNMVEKDVPEDVSEEKRKIANPDMALLKIAYMYLLGWGLDDGKREKTRELETIVALSDEEPKEGAIAFSVN